MTHCRTIHLTVPNKIHFACMRCNFILSEIYITLEPKSQLHSLVDYIYTYIYNKTK